VYSTAPTSHLLPVHRAVMAAAGPEALAGIVRDPTPHEWELIEGFKARIADLDDEQLPQRHGITPDLRKAIEEALA
jgi:hypothetical protein